MMIFSISPATQDHHEEIANMSTNYYWVVDPIVTPTGESIEMDVLDPRIHLGKRVNNTFIWAQDPIRAMMTLVSTPDLFVLDEYGQMLTSTEFLSILFDLDDIESSIDRRFV
jgi:hypothetical protein